MWYIMDWKHYFALAAATYVCGLFGGWALTRWKDAYDEAVEAGAVAE